MKLAALLLLTGVFSFPADPISRLIDRLARGEIKLEHRDVYSYLPALLEQLHVPADSQVLVYGKNSFQAARISQSNPRAIYFNDDVSVAFIPGADLIELSALNPERGVVFYTLDARNSARANFDTCNMACHGMNDTAILMVQSSGSGMTDHRTPMASRWGGWYVTGSHAGSLSRGLKPAGHFETGKYLLPTSDIVALMTLEHQTRMSTLITGVNRQARAVAKGEAQPDFMDTTVEQLVTYMLFANEAPLEGPVTPSSTFAETFAARGPRDSQGRSLREFDLKTRLFRYPLSYMVYSEMFATMEPMGRDRVYRRLYEVLRSAPADDKFARLSAADRRAILEILRDTKPDLPAYWQP